MENIIDVRTVTSNHIAQSIIVTRSRNRPRFFNLDKFKNNRWPTPAHLTYEAIVSKSFASFYWCQDGSRRNILLNAISKELSHEGRNRIYRRIEGQEFFIQCLSIDEFQHIIMTRLQNLRYQSSRNTEIEFHFDFNNFQENEKIMVEAPSQTVMYNGVFQFNSCINNNYCYIQFDSRSHILKWKKDFVKGIELHGERPKRRVKPTQHYINESTVNNSIARESATIEIQNQNDGSTYDQYMEEFGYGDENKQSLDAAWLEKQGLVTITETCEDPCVICGESISLQETVYNIKCYGKLQHIFHKRCIYTNVVEYKRVNCPICKDDWLS